jgi:DNA-binding HxlR family transcriptional regulator
MARSYGEFCGVARALDVVGDRWSLLIVRELLIRAARYGELQDSLPGIPSNLLADRVRSLEAAGVLDRRFSVEARAVVYELTHWGQQLRETVEALVRWGTPLMVPGQGKDAFRPQWLSVALGALLRGRRSRRPVNIEIVVDGGAVGLRIDRDGVHVPSASEAPAARLRTTPFEALGLAAGLIPLDTVIEGGSLEGSRTALAIAFSPDAAGHSAHLPDPSDSADPIREGEEQWT